MKPSELLIYFAALLAAAIVFSLAYLQFAYTPRRIERIIKIWASPTNLVVYLLVILAAFLASIGQ